VISLQGKHAFVTGGGRGIGRATAVMLARAGAAVAVGYRSRKADAEEALRAGAAAAIQADLGDPAAATRAVGDAARAILNVNGGSVLCG
jgi:NAD(P)-dependent dehydrogenase (short-subunit alcohol dehydrogenase family)